MEVGRSEFGDVIGARRSKWLQRVASLHSSIRSRARRLAPTLAVPLTHRVEEDPREPKQTIYLSRYDAVQSAKANLKMSKTDLKYLVGRKCEYKFLNESHHSCKVRAVGAYVERHMREMSQERQAATLNFEDVHTRYQISELQRML